MNYREEIASAFDQAIRVFGASVPIMQLRSGRLTLAHYKSILQEVYHYTKENPQLQVAAAVMFRGEDRQWVRQFFGHASSEIGHDQLALNDLAALGGDVLGIPREFPLPATVALTAFPFFTIQYRDPLGYLGYLYFLEFMPTSEGASYAEALERAGIPRRAMTFLVDHTTIDVAHNKLMERYLAALIRTHADAAAVCYAIRATGYLYAQMLQSAIDRVSTAETYGDDPVEVGRISFHPCEFVQRGPAGAKEASKLTTVEQTGKE